MAITGEAEPAPPPPAPDERKSPPQAAEEIVDKAASVTTKVERANDLYRDLADGKLELAQVNNAIDALIGVFGRLDREGKHEEALRVARILSKLLALARRWAALLEMFKSVERAGELLGRPEVVAWAKHELGSVRLITNDTIGANRELDEAMRLRGELDDRPGLTVTEGNLRFLCKRLRRMVKKKKLVPKRHPLALASPFLVAIVALSVAAAGVAAGMAVGGAGENKSSSTVEPSNSSQSSGGKPGTSGSKGDETSYELMVNLTGKGSVVSDPEGIACATDIVAATEGTTRDVVFEEGGTEEKDAKAQVIEEKETDAQAAEARETDAQAAEEKETEAQAAEKGETESQAAEKRETDQAIEEKKTKEGSTGGTTDPSTSDSNATNTEKTNGSKGPSKPSASCPGSFDADSVVTLTAKPASGWRFSDFGERCAHVSEKSCEVKMSSDTTVSVEFEEKTED